MPDQCHHGKGGRYQLVHQYHVHFSKLGLHTDVSGTLQSPLRMACLAQLAQGQSAEGFNANHAAQLVERLSHN
jgi:hypothetical protein